MKCKFPPGIEGLSLHLMADNGCQPTSLAFMGACAAMGIRQAVTSYSNPKGWRSATAFRCARATPASANGRCA